MQHRAAQGGDDLRRDSKMTLPQPDLSQFY
jgi:hypothetical protein